MRTRRKLVAGIMAVVLAVTSVITLNVTPVQAEDKGTPMYRMYNPNSGEHFYTSASAERDNLILAGWNYEDYGFIASSTGGDPVYRMYNANAGDHHYTTNSAEKDMLQSLGWKYEGIGWYTKDTGNKCEVKLYRLYNPYSQTASHHYTLDKSEKDYLVSIGWQYEGTAWTSMHTVRNNKAIKEATCREPGHSGGAICTTCGITYDGEELPINPNNHVHMTYHPEETKHIGGDMESAYEEYVCKFCGENFGYIQTPDWDYMCKHMNNHGVPHLVTDEEYYNGLATEDEYNESSSRIFEYVDCIVYNEGRTWTEPAYYSCSDCGAKIPL